MSTADDLENILRVPPPWVMGILNVTPDSFSDGGKFAAPESGAAELERLRSIGADIIDIGAEATGPKSAPISADEEIRRLAPLFAEPPPAFISIDTYKAATARFALERGARMINDVSALRADPEMTSAVSEHDAFLVMMFAKGSGPLPHANDEEVRFGDVVNDVAAFLLKRAELAMRAGVPERRIILDPGMGKFLSNDPKHSWEMLERFEELCAAVHPFPVLVGTSRKGFLGGKLADRDPISQTTAADAAKKGARIIRTHRPDLVRR